MARRSRNAIIMKTFIMRLFKGVAMGAANVIPRSDNTTTTKGRITN